MTQRFDPAPSTERETAAQLLRENLAQVRRLRGIAGDDPTLAAARLRLRQWQAERLQRTYRDLLASEAFAPAAQFFLSDLYGPKDFSERDREVERIVPTLVSVLPSGGIRTVAMAVELDALSEALDAALLGQLRSTASIDGAGYAAAYRACANRDQRLRQIELVGEIGRALDRLTRKPLIGAALRLMHGPAHAAGLGAVHDFLRRGYQAFRHMGRSSNDFLSTVECRERDLMEQLFGGASNPFALPE